MSSKLSLKNVFKMRLLRSIIFVGATASCTQPAVSSYRTLFSLPQSWSAQLLPAAPRAVPPAGGAAGRSVQGEPQHRGLQVQQVYAVQSASLKKHKNPSKLQADQIPFAHAPNRTFSKTQQFAFTKKKKMGFHQKSYIFNVH